MTAQIVLQSFSINGTTLKVVIGQDDTPVAPLENYMNYSVRKLLHVHGDPSRARGGHRVPGLTRGTSMTSIINI